MPNRSILTFPNLRLKKKSKPVTHFNTELRSLIKDMVDTLDVQMGLGLAAPQIGILDRVVIVKGESLGYHHPLPQELFSGALVLINPELELSLEKEVWQESCLSVPGYVGKVKRSKYVVLRYQAIDGSLRTLNAEWPFSAALQHECDHLIGRLYIDYLGAFERTSIVKKIMKRKKKLAQAAKEYDRKMRLERKGIVDEEAYKRMTHGSGKRKKKKAKRVGKSFGRNKK